MKSNGRHWGLGRADGTDEGDGPMKFQIREAAILDFDIENRPLSYWYDGQCTAEITVIAYSWGLDRPVHCWLLGRDDPEDMLSHFVEMYDLADIVTGHYIRRHDLPIINGALLEYGFPPLGVKLTWDTKLDLRPTKDLSMSQESLGLTLCTRYEKIHMSQPEWRAANRLEQIELAEARCTTDVRQHQELRLKLDELGMLQSPKSWNPET